MAALRQLYGIVKLPFRAVTILVLSIESHPGHQAEKSTKFIPVIDPAWLPGSYEEALRGFFFGKKNSQLRDSKDSGACEVVDLLKVWCFMYFVCLAYFTFNN